MQRALLFWVFGIFLSVWSACGPAAVCTVGETKACTCLGLTGTQTCKSDGSGFEVCRCITESEKSGEKLPADAGAEPADAPDEPTSTPDEPTSAPDEPTSAPDEPTSTPDEPQGSDGGPTEPVKEVAPESCTTDEFFTQGRCYKVADFCEGKIQQPGFPAFSTREQQAMARPYDLIWDATTKKPLFCKTADGYYFLPGAGYGTCDLDKDGWINIEAYRAVTSTTKDVRDNARCGLKTFEYVVYHAEGKPPQLQKLKDKASMIETFRNDGGEKLIERPVYTNGQAPLPKAPSSNCTADSDCTNQVCYLGHCVAGRRFEPGEINTLTKACIAGIDLNDNQINDASESPSDTPTPAGEFKPLISVGYFVELHYGHYQADYDNKGIKIPVYHIYERTRDKAPDQQGLALNCMQKSDGFVPDHWKRCQLKDNQQCQDPNDPTKTRPGLTFCWFKDVERLTPSLFKCSIFANTTGNYFHPDEYGFDKNYSRTVCSFKAKLNESDPTKRDFQFECTQDTGNRKPDPTKQEVGWACVSFKKYSKPAEYTGGCVDEVAEQVCGTKKDGEDVTHIKNEEGSYGLARAWAPCGTSLGKGVCDKARRTCTGGRWLDCDRCNNCPQFTAGQKAACPGGVWPIDSCREQANRDDEVCDGLDNDCDGQVDENLPTKNYYPDKDKDGYGSGTPVAVCPAMAPKGYADKVGDCDENNPAINPGAAEVCDGIDNNCNGSVDENLPLVSYYKDDDNDGVGQKTSTPALRGCVKQGDNNTICKGKNDCVSLNYTTDCKAQSCKYKSSNTDCCDSDEKAKPGQTTYFASKNACGSWDYNCNGSTEKGEAGKTTNLHLCSCATSVPYYENAVAWCYIPEDGIHKACGFDGARLAVMFRYWVWDSSNWDFCSRNPCVATSTNGTNKCQLDLTHTYKRTQNFSGSCDRGLFCSKTNVSCDTDIDASYTPKATDGTSLFAVKTSEFGSSSTCHFMPDGTEPDCGENTSVISRSTAQPRPTHKVSRKEVCSGSTSGCTKGFRCVYDFDVSYSSDYQYFKMTSTSTGVQVGCR